MTPGDKLRLLRKIEDCLRESPVGDSLPKHWVDQLFDKHREKPERSVQVCTTVKVELATTDGWLTLEQGGGGIQFHIWAPGAQRDRSVAEIADRLSESLSSVLPTTCIKVRVARPHEFLARKGWSAPNGDHS